MLNDSALASRWSKLEDHGISLTTVLARVAGEIVEEVGGSLATQQLLSDARLTDITVLVCQVVLALVGGTAGTAHVVALAAISPPPREL